MDINPESSEQATKKQKTSQEDLSKALVPVGISAAGTSTGAGTAIQANAELLFREQKRISLELNPLYMRRLKSRSEVGYRRPVGKKKLALKTFEINVTALRTAMSFVLKYALIARYHSASMMRATDIATEIEDIVPLTVDICMSALYAKLRSIHKAYGVQATRYASAPSYTKEVEFPLPFALAIQEFGSFETQCMEENFVYAPTYPEGTTQEGRVSANYSLTEYQSYLPTIKEHGIPCKSIDSRLKSGSAWWTYIVKNYHNTSDLVCPLPPSHYSDLSAILRSCFLAPSGANNACQNIVSMPEDSPNYGTRLREMQPGSSIRSFLALCHGPEEEWSYGTS